MLSCALAVLLSAGIVYADESLAPGAYTVDVKTHYIHPETGVIEDSGGEDAKEIGQSMTESTVSSQGLYEVGSDGNYATVRIVLMDAVGEVSYFVADKPALAEITQEGVNSEGKTYADFRFKDDDITKVIKCKLYVEPMDREVIFYMTLSNPVEGSADFKVTKQKEDPLADSRLEGLQKLEALEDIGQKDLQIAKDQVTNASSQEEIDKAVHGAEDKNKDAEAQNQLGLVKSEALNKVDEIQGLTQDEKAHMKQKIKDATTAEEVEKALEKDKSSGPTQALITGAVAIAAVIAVAVYLKKGKNNDR